MADEPATTEVEVTPEAATNEAAASNEAPAAEAPIEAAPETPAEDQGAEAATQEGEDGEEKPAVPETPDAYDIALPEEVKLEGGQAIAFNADDPLLKEFQTMAHEMGMDQEGFTKFLSLGANFLKTNIDAQTTVTRQQVQDELGKLGKDEAAQTARVEKLSTALAKVGGEQAAFSIMSDIRSAEAFEAVEKLVERANGSGGKRTPAITGTITETPPLHDRLFGSKQ